MKILAMEKPVSGADQSRFTEDLLRQEAAKLWQLLQSDVVREAYFRADRHEAVLILECGSPEEAYRCLAGLPLATAGLIRFEVIPSSLQRF